MTLPVLGYPDWVRTYAAARTRLYLQFASVINAPEISGAIAVGNMHSVGMRLFANANHIRVQLDWFFDQALSAFVTNDVVDVRQGGVFDQSITTKAPFLRVTATPFGGATSTYTVLVYEAPFDFVSQLSALDNILITQDGVNVPAGTTSTFDAARVFAGPAVFAYDFFANPNYIVRVRALAADGASPSYCRLSQVTGLAERSLFLAAAPVRVTANNADAADHSFFCALYSKPLYP